MIGEEEEGIDVTIGEGMIEVVEDQEEDLDIVLMEDEVLDVIEVQIGEEEVEVTAEVNLRFRDEGDLLVLRLLLLLLLKGVVEVVLLMNVEQERNEVQVLIQEQQRKEVEVALSIAAEAGPQHEREPRRVLSHDPPVLQDDQPFLRRE